MHFHRAADYAGITSPARSFHSKAEVYLCKNLRISCLAVPSSPHAFANFSLSSSALLLITRPFSLRHKSIVCRISIPTASRVPSAASPFLARGLRPFPVLTWKSSKATLRFSVRCAAAAGWSAVMGQQILCKGKHEDELCKLEEKLTKEHRFQEIQ